MFSARTFPCRYLLRPPGATVGVLQVTSARLRLSARFLDRKDGGIGTKSSGGVATNSRSSTIDLFEIGWVADRFTYQFQRACAQEWHQADGQQFEISCAISA